MTKYQSNIGKFQTLKCKLKTLARTIISTILGKNPFKKILKREKLESTVLEQEIEIINKLGLHARAAAKLVKIASSFESSIEIEKQDQRVNAKSIMSVMMLAASRGNLVKLYIEGTDQKDAMKAVIDLISDKFGEDE